MGNQSSKDKLKTEADLRQLDHCRQVLRQSLQRDGQALDAEQFLRGACDQLKQVIASGETPDFTEEHLLVIVLQALIDKYRGQKGDQALARELDRYLGVGRYNRNKVYRLRKKYDLRARDTTRDRRDDPPGEAARADSDTQPRGRTPESSGPERNPVSSQPEQLYLRRPADDQIEALAETSGTTLIIRGPRGFGTSRLLYRYLQHCQTHGKQVVSVDFSILDLHKTQDYTAALNIIASDMRHTMGIDSGRNESFDTQQKFTYFMEDVILKQAGGPVVVAFDRADYLFGRKFQDDFFSMVRYWHNARSRFKPNNPWRHTDLVLVTSVDPARMIRDPDRSPFSVGETVTVGSFDLDMYRQVNQQSQANLSDEQLAGLFGLLHGHPSLTLRAFEHLTRKYQPISYSELIKSAADAPGPFSDHLTSMERILRKGGVLKSYQQFIRKGKELDEDALAELLDIGLILSTDRGPQPFCQLYERYFGK